MKKIFNCISKRAKTPFGFNTLTSNKEYIIHHLIYHKKRKKTFANKKEYFFEEYLHIPLLQVSQ